jgi:gliding motility-associated-like protein
VTHSFKDTIELALNKAAFIWRTSESVSHPTSVRGEFDWTSEGSISSKNRQGFKLFTMAIPISGFPSFTYGIALDIDHYGVVRLDIEGSGYTLIEVKPQYLLSSSYHFPKFETYAGQSLSVQAMEDSTDIFFNGRFLIRLDRGKRFDTAIVEDLSLSANQPFSAIVHPWPDTLGNYTPPNGVLSNFALQANGDQELIKHSKVPVLHRNKNIINFLSLVSPSTDTGLVRINGQVPQSNWKTFTGDPAWSYLQERLGLGVHDVQSTAGFHGYFYTSAPYFPDSVFGNYAYVLTEYAPWPEDSFTTYLGREPTKLLPWDEWKDTSLTFCPGDTIYGLASALRNTDWLWMANDSIIAEQTVAEDRANKPIALVLPYGNELELKLQDRNGCLVSKSLKLNLKDLSPLELSYEITPRCEAYQIMLKAENTAPSAQLNWLIDGKAYTGNNILIKHKTADDSLQFSLFRQEKGCQDSLSTAIPLKGADDNSYRFPNLLTPNGDGINDQWCFEDWLGYEACFSIYITDRNGQSVFQSSDPQRCWTPQSQLTGVFYYVLKYGAEEKKGFISFF